MRYHCRNCSALLEVPASVRLGDKVSATRLRCPHCGFVSSLRLGGHRFSGGPEGRLGLFRLLRLYDLIRQHSFRESLSGESRFQAGRWLLEKIFHNIRDRGLTRLTFAWVLAQLALGAALGDLSASAGFPPGLKSLPWFLGFLFSQTFILFYHYLKIPFLTENLTDKERTFLLQSLHGFLLVYVLLYFFSWAGYLAAAKEVTLVQNSNELNRAAYVWLAAILGVVAALVGFLVSRNRAYLYFLFAAIFVNFLQDFLPSIFYLPPFEFSLTELFFALSGISEGDIPQWARFLFGLLLGPLALFGLLKAVLFFFAETYSVRFERVIHGLILVSGLLALVHLVWVASVAELGINLGLFLILYGLSQYMAASLRQPLWLWVGFWPAGLAVFTLLELTIYLGAWGQWGFFLLLFLVWAVPLVAQRLAWYRKRGDEEKDTTAPRVFFRYWDYMAHTVHGWSLWVTFFVLMISRGLGGAALVLGLFYAPLWYWLNRYRGNRWSQFSPLLLFLSSLVMLAGGAGLFGYGIFWLLLALALVAAGVAERVYLEPGYRRNIVANLRQ